MEPPKKKQKVVYGVRRGKKVGVYETWKECEEQIKGFPGPSFRKFYSNQDALDFVHGIEKK